MSVSYSQGKVNYQIKVSQNIHINEILLVYLDYFYYFFARFES